MLLHSCCAFAFPSVSLTKGGPLTDIYRVFPRWVINFFLDVNNVLKTLNCPLLCPHTCDKMIIFIALLLQFMSPSLRDRPIMMMLVMTCRLLLFLLGFSRLLMTPERFCWQKLEFNSKLFVLFFWIKKLNLMCFCCFIIFCTVATLWKILAASFKSSTLKKFPPCNFVLKYFLVLIQADHQRRYSEKNWVIKLYWDKNENEFPLFYSTS